MAPRRSAVVQEEPQLGGLSFNQPLSWRAGRPIPLGDLLGRLDALSSELREMDQEDTDKDSLTAVAKELAGQHLLGHKDKGVRAFTACCLVDILKICAPNAPFTGSQLKDIFTLFIVHILPALADPANAYNTQHKYVLMSLAQVKSIILLMDIPNSDPLTLHLFSAFFDIVSGTSKHSTGEPIAKDVQYHMMEILVAVVDEHAGLPTEVTDIMMAQFLRTGTGKTKTKDVQSDDKQSTLLPKEYPEAYNMVQTICNSCEGPMGRHISQYFAEIIMSVSGGAEPPKSNGHRRESDAVDSDDEEATARTTEHDMRELIKAHNLLRELWRASPNVLQNVIPQLELQLSAESVQLRAIATETLGDVISGIGPHGPPPPATMDPAAYPPLRLEDELTSTVSESILIKPISPLSFAHTHPGVYHSFIGRQNDKAATVRATWTTAIGRILATSAGGIGLNRDDEKALVEALEVKLKDSDEKVRIAAVKAIANLSFREIMSKLAPNGGVSTPGSVLSTLADRARDRKPAVRVEAMTTLGRMWGVAIGEIADGNDDVVSALGMIPSRICDAFYANDTEVNVLLDHVLFEQLLPLNYPPTKAKSKGSKNNNGESQGTQTNGDGSFDADKIRVERILILVKSLDQKSKKALFALLGRQSAFANVLAAFLKRCTEYNGGVMDDNVKETKAKLDAIIKWFAAYSPDPLRTTSDLQKYAKMHDRRSYQLLQYTMDIDSDFKTVHKSIKEFTKRMQAAPGAPAGLMETLEPIIYRSASLIYNKSHLPGLLQFSRSDEKGLGATAHEVMHEISQRMPKIFSSNVKELCKTLQDNAPSDVKANDPGSVETLRACAEFAKSRPEDIPQDRKFVQTLNNYALYGTPPKAAKYAVSILMAASDRKEMHAKELLEKTTTDWKYGEDHFLTKLATISQLSVMDSHFADELSDEILDITTQQILLKVRLAAQDTDPSWQTDVDLGEECQAKIWAIKILVNRLRGTEDPEAAKQIAKPVFKLLNALIFNEGEISKQKDTPKAHKSRLRLQAAQSLLKLCTSKIFDGLLTPTEFNRLAFVAQDRLAAVRRGFIEKLQKYLVRGKLSNRFYTIIFLAAFEPELEFKNSIITWIRSRAKVFAEKKSPILESIFARLLSLLAHHPDYSADPVELKDHSQYILYYIMSVASEENLGLIYKYAERVKQARDGINPEDSDRLYVLSDLAQAVIRKWEEKKGWSMQIWPAKVGLPTGLFSALPSHEVAQEIAETQYLPDGMEDLLNSVVRKADQKKKRKPDESDGQPSAKKIKSESKPVKKDRVTKEKKTPKPPKKQKQIADTSAPSSAAARRSSRGTSARKSYADRDDDEDEEEMMGGVAKWKYVDGDSDKSSGDGDDGEEEDAEDEKLTTPQPVEESEADPEPEPELMDEDMPEADEEEAEPTPPRSNGRKSKAPHQSAKKSSPLVETTTRLTKQKAKEPIVANPRSPTMPKTKAKRPLPTRSRGKDVKGREKGKSKATDIFDINDSD
ncbi:Precocious dissociation of sisters 5 [Hyphodiscus hymeniophilus]|uniref:Precocious dissociation of sisters 5 n=1 Tax=Hyphodiscus hymeniophilus TaxID=353542 RepID=A0A9P6VGL7_9HELO|nr:Precocious dissociation of sisters 5 [Hyphodiscus hymeniophilus]